MGPTAQGVVEIQLAPVYEFQHLELPGDSDSSEAWDNVTARLTSLSRDGWGIMSQTPRRLILGKQVAVRRLSVDMTRVVLPFAQAMAATRQ
jgi:hypothetical protein